MPGSRTPDATAELSPAKALQMLKEGNVRFLNGLNAARDPHADVSATSKAQWPYAAIVACMDSRVATEMIFDIGIGDMFSLRIAGNVCTDGIIGSLEYAAAVVGVKAIVVMGHSHCGAVKAACDNVELGNLTGLLGQIQPAVQLTRGFSGSRNSHNSGYVQAVAENNARVAIEQLPQRSPILKDLIEQGKLLLVPAMYDVATGLVTFLDADDLSGETVAPAAEAVAA